MKHEHSHQLHLSHAERRKRLRELKDRRREIFQSIHESHYNEQLEMRKKLHELEMTMDTLHGGRRCGRCCSC